jgi:hypothetical protein
MMATPLNNLNPYEILRNTSSGAESSPRQMPPALAPTDAATLRDIVEVGFDEMFGEMADSPANDTHFWLREIFREAAHHVDSILNEVKGESQRLTNIELRLDAIESRLDLILQRLPRPMDKWSDRIVALEHTVKDSKEIWPILDDVHHRQLSQICGDISNLEEGIEVLKPKFWQGLDDVNIRVDDILAKLGTHVPSRRDMSSLDLHRAEDLQPMGEDTHLPRMTPIPPTSPPHPRQGVGLSPAVNPGCNETVHPTNNGQRWSYEDTEGVRPP